MDIQFIAGKWISTKSIADRVITAHFTVPASFIAKDYLNKPLIFEMRVNHSDKVLEADASMCNDPGTNYYYNPTHDTYAIKLDITLPDLLIMGFIFTSTLGLYIQDNKL